MGEKIEMSARERALERAAVEFCSRVDEGVVKSRYTYCRMRNALGTGKHRYNIEVRKALEEQRRKAIAGCKTCGALLVFFRLESGKWMPCDPNGEPHWATCPGADKHRHPEPRRSRR